SNFLDDDIVNKYSEMHVKEREFLLNLLHKYKPKKILEVGIAAGANSVLILDYLAKYNLLNDVTLNSIDYNTFYYRDNSKNSGFLVDELAPNLKKYWNLYTPGLAADHMDKIGKDIDFCIIDTMHSSPGEALDFLFVLPYLSKNAVIIMHDLTFHIYCNVPYSNICSILFSSFFGKKYYLKEHYTIYDPDFQNIGYCILDDNHLDKDKLKVYFRLLNLPWIYMLDIKDIEISSIFFKKHYGEEFVNLFKQILYIQDKWFKEGIINSSELWKLKILKFQTEYGTAKQRIQNHLSYKLGKALIANSKSLWGYIRMPYVLSYIKDKHQFEQKAYEEKIKQNPNSALPPLETYPDYNEALKEKECFTYKLGEEFIKASKNWYTGGFIKLWFKIRDEKRI
ncbi:class I SAM-dependent methyltransferase, partial [Campylobacter jejuni]|nr:class I SAM-dependent methyltransferase [Campylobacter jejuni]ECL6304000.1 class I SAM-dependent methyltransferase [Campylobacter jejuni]EIX5015618.1 class I SAM-dependent methyltransferase [Campylobacter jejuni]ELG6554836.1 class I SAM-dependent methyltransferase [Campylobacter jejuni]